jgi:Na+/proline symporter
LTFGLFWKRANSRGAMTSMVLGLVSWILLEAFAPEGFWPPQLVGVLMSLAGMLVGSLLTAPPQEAAEMPPSENQQPSLPGSH